MKTPKWAILTVIWLSLAMTVFGTLALARPDDKKTYDLSEIQKLRMQVKQKDAQLAQIQVSIAQAAFQKAIDDFNAEIKTIEKENSWPETLQVDPQTLVFSEPPKPPDDPAPPAESSPPTAPKPPQNPVGRPDSEKPAGPTPAAK